MPSVIAEDEQIVNTAIYDSLLLLLSIILKFLFN